MVVRVLDERVHGKDDQIRLGFGVINEIEIDEFLLLDVLRLHVLEYVRKETADIFREML